MPLNHFISRVNDANGPVPTPNALALCVVPALVTSISGALHLGDLCVCFLRNVQGALLCAFCSFRLGSRSIFGCDKNEMRSRTERRLRLKHPFYVSAYLLLGANVLFVVCIYNWRRISSRDAHRKHMHVYLLRECVQL